MVRAKLMLIGSALALSGCGVSMGLGGGAFKDGVAITTDAANPGEFDKITVSGSDNVRFTIAPEFSIRAEGESGALEKLRYIHTSDTLKIGRTNGWSVKDGDANIYVTAPRLSSVRLSGSGDVAVDMMRGPGADIALSGSGNINVANIQSDALGVTISGSGDIRLAGASKSAKIAMSGSGDIWGQPLRADNADVAISGSGDVRLSSDGAVSSRISGSGDVTIYGSAKCTSKISGSGSVTCK